MQTRIHNLFIGIDVGSTAIKLGLVNTEGKLISYFNSPYSTKKISEDHVEQDPNDWIKLIVKGLTEFKNNKPWLSIEWAINVQPSKYSYICR